MTPSHPRSLDAVTFHVHATNHGEGGTEINDLPSPKLSLTMPSMEMGKNEVPLHFIGHGDYAGKGQFTMSGDWLVTVTAKDRTINVSQSFPVTVR